jgi:hypothetical protein
LVDGSTQLPQMKFLKVFIRTLSAISYPDFGGRRLRRRALGEPYYPLPAHGQSQLTGRVGSGLA